MEKRVLVYTNHYYPENFRINELSFILSESNYNLHVITCIPNYPKGTFFEGYSYFKKRTELLNKNLKITRLPLIPRLNGGKINLILNYISYFISTLIYTFHLILLKKKYDFIIVHHTSPIFITLSPIVYKFFKKNKIILWDLDMWPDTLIALNILKNKKLIKFLNLIMKYVYKSYDKVLIGSKSFLEIAKKRVSENKIEFFPNWAEEIFLKEIKEPKKSIVFPSGFNILYTGNIGEAQDFKTILDSAKELCQHNINFLFIGEGRYKKKFEIEIKKRLIKNIYLYDFQILDKIPYYLSISNALILTLKNKDIFFKTVPAKLQTYMTAKKPIIGIIGGEGKEIIENSKCGISVLPGDQLNFKNKILQLRYSEIDILKKMGENAYEYYLNNFDFKNRIKQIIKILE